MADATTRPQRLPHLPTELQDWVLAGVGQLDDAVEMTDAEGKLVFVNAAFERLTGWSFAEVIGRTPAEVLRSGAHPANYYDDIWRLNLSGKAWRGLLVSRRRDGTLVECDCSVTPVVGSLGEITHLMCVRRDARPRLRTEAELRDAVSRFALASAGANDGMWAWDLRSGEVFFSARFNQMMGGEPRETTSSFYDWMGRVHAEDRPGFEASLRAHLRGESPHIEAEYRVRCADDSYRWMLCRGLAERAPGGEAERVAGSQADAHARRTAEARLQRAAMHDPLTGLPNRALLHERLRWSLRRRSREAAGQLAVFFVDLDGFKFVNDSLGHAAGDRLLREIAVRLARVIRSADCVARIGGDEFIAVVDGARDADAIREVAARVLEVTARPVRLDAQEVTIGACVGIAVASPGSTADDLLQDADMAMYAAKQAGRGRFEFFQPAMRTAATLRVRVATDLRRGIDRGELELHYQPVVRLDNRAVAGLEALVRWRHPERGLVGPGEFIPVAEQAGLIGRLETWVLAEATRQLAAWRRDGVFDQVRMAVNLSPAHASLPELLDEVDGILASSGVPPRLLVLEVTEGLFLGEEARVDANLRGLRARGVRVCLDDFGTGYSSLGYLHRYRVDSLKVDRQFVAGLGQGRGAEEIIRAVVGLGRVFGVNIVAEGVETEAQFEACREFGCTHGQGFGIYRPLPPRDLLAAMAAAARR
jgi:diguanylate cyclase (GGDEF)-like protein/PAS domain S-box-containing protein